MRRNASPVAWPSRVGGSRTWHRWRATCAGAGCAVGRSGRTGEQRCNSDSGSAAATSAGRGSREHSLTAKTGELLGHLLVPQEEPSACRRSDDLHRLVAREHVMPNEGRGLWIEDVLLTRASLGNHANSACKLRRRARLIERRFEQREPCEEFLARERGHV